MARHRDSFLDLVARHVDILFANEGEIKALYATDSCDEAVAQARGQTKLAALTRGPKGSLLITATEEVEIAAERVERVVDTTGAGDLYAAGVLYGVTHGESLAAAGRRGSIAAASRVQYIRGHRHGFHSYPWVKPRYLA